MNTWYKINGSELSINLLILILLCFLSGCDTMGVGNSTKPELSKTTSLELVKQAQEASLSGATERAQALLEEATRLNPAEKLAWQKLAQIHFEKSNYVQAIIAGKEVLARDEKNLDARSIVLVSALRIAAKGLGDMVSANQFTGDARSEAHRVAQVLRESLGESVLVPATIENIDSDNPNTSSSSKIKTIKRISKKTISNATSSFSSSTAGKNDASSNPFGSLK